MKDVENHSQPVTEVLDEEVLRENPLGLISACQLGVGKGVGPTYSSKR